MKTEIKIVAQFESEDEVFWYAYYKKRVVKYIGKDNPPKSVSLFMANCQKPEKRVFDYGTWTIYRQGQT